MDYIQSTLIKDEEVILSPKIHSIVYWNPVFCFIGLVLFFLFVGGGSELWGLVWLSVVVTFFACLIWYIYNMFYYKNVEMAVTNKRVVAKTGIITVHTEELQWNKIESIEIRQGVWGRMFNFGDVHFTGTGTSFVHFTYVCDPWSVKAKASEILSA